MKTLTLQLIFLFLFLAAHAQPDPKTRLNDVFDVKSNYVLVTAHRGDWRNTAENSIQALKNSVAMGVDIMEIDLKQTKDGYLVIMHDETIDRTTTGKGKVSDFTLQELKTLYLRNGMGHITQHRIPTFREILQAAKDKILIDVDKGYDYFPQVLKELREEGMIGQAIVNVKNSTTLKVIESEQGAIPVDVTIMPIVDLTLPHAAQIIESYKGHKRTIIQANFKTDSLTILSNLSKLRNFYGLWINSLWPSQNGGHDDDRAVEGNSKDETWGWLINHKANMIQTDRPKELVEYLQQKKLHN